VKDEDGVKEIKIKGVADIERTTDYTHNGNCLNPAEFQGSCSQTTLHSQPKLKKNK
jgi:hypothetical protein